MTSNKEYAIRAMASMTARVAVRGEITTDLAAKVCEQIRAQHRAGTIDVFIDSQGGDVASAFDIVDALRAHHGEVVTHGEGAVHSAAVLVFMAVGKRILARDATLLLHSCGGMPLDGTRWTAADHEKTAKRLAVIDAGVAAMIAERAGCAVAKIDAEMSTEAFTTTARALRLGIATALSR
jgi:ATP-dependent protease ClpP protease subunit